MEGVFVLSGSGHGLRMTIYCSFYENNTENIDVLFFIREQKTGQ